MSEDEHKCHCPHVVIIKHQYDKTNWSAVDRCVNDMRRISYVIGGVFLLVVGMFLRELWAGEKAHIRSEDTASHDGERMGPDRIPKPKPVQPE